MEDLYRSLKSVNSILFFVIVIIAILPFCFTPSKAYVRDGRAVAKKGEAAQFFADIDETYSLLPTPPLAFIGKNSRPDAADPTVAIGLVGSGQRIDLRDNEAGYLCRGQNGWEFSHEVTPLSFTPRSERLLELNLEIGEICERRNIEIEDKRTLARPGGLNVLKNAKLCASDKLFDLYGGPEYTGVEKRMRLYQESSRVLFVSDHTTLIFDGYAWREPKDSEDTRDFPLAFFQIATPHKAEVTVWDESGFTCSPLTLEPHQGDQMPHPSITRISQRSKRRASCTIDGKEHFLTKGDWLLKGGKGWRLLKGPDEIKQVLTYERTGELFIFDGILQNEGTSLFCGTLFDSSRSQEKHIVLPMKGLRENEIGKQI